MLLNLHIIWMYAGSMESRREERVTVALLHRRELLYAFRTSLTFISPTGANSDFSVFDKMDFRSSDLFDF